MFWLFGFLCSLHFSPSYAIGLPTPFFTFCWLVLAGCEATVRGGQMNYDGSLSKVTQSTDLVIYMWSAFLWSASWCLSAASVLMPVWCMSTSHGAGSDNVKLFLHLTCNSIENMLRWQWKSCSVERRKNGIKSTWCVHNWTEQLDVNASF